MLRFVLCADDFALTRGTSEAILALLRKGRLSATSAMTNGASWPDGARSLKELSGGADLGVHLNLTSGESLSVMSSFAPSGRLPSLGKVLRGALLGGLPLSEIADEFRRQIDAFAQATGREPDFLDGHQHVHVFPRIREALFEAVDSIGLARRIHVRDPADRPGAIAARRLCAGKALLIASLASGFGEALAERGVVTNDSFAGFSPFSPRRDYGRDFARYLRRPGKRHLVMCHPGLFEPGNAADAIAATRPKEHEFLVGDAFPAQLERHGAQVVRFRELPMN